MPEVRVIRSHELSDLDRAALRRLLDEAYQGDFSDDDWGHALGGWHAVVDDGGALVGHASVVERRVTVGVRELRAGYVEAVATLPARQGTGLGTAVMESIGDLIRARFDVGLLSTGDRVRRAQRR